uniref:PH domain-containing protein n=1 Tax=Eptatretus burgeri TaxID=7764 RepID=A0A8C4WTJ2_EPTBU
MKSEEVERRTAQPSPVPPTEGSDGADSGIANTGEPENVLDIMPPPPPSQLAWNLSSRGWLDDHSLGLYRSSTWSKGGSDSRDYLSDWGEDGDAPCLLGDCTIPSESGESITEVVADCRVPRGGVRKTGWLWFKHLLHCKGRKVEIVPRRKWRRSWIVLRGCSLQFFERRPEGSEEPKFVLGVSEALVQACPEHPRREFVLCLSNNVGNVIIFQAGSQTELETWITAIHSACASRFASRCAASMRPAVLDMFEETGSLKDMSLGPHSALRIEVCELKRQIELDEKMKNEAMLKLEEVCDRLSRKAILEQVSQWEQNLERLGLDVFRLRCYLASLEGLEPPNPKAALTLATRSKKESMHRLRLASVSCLHALVCRFILSLCILLFPLHRYSTTNSHAA